MNENKARPSTMSRPEKSVALMIYHNNRLFGVMIIITGSMRAKQLRLPLYLKCRQGLNTPLKGWEEEKIKMGFMSSVWCRHDLINWKEHLSVCGLKSTLIQPNQAQLSIKQTTTLVSYTYYNMKADDVHYCFKNTQLYWSAHNKFTNITRPNPSGNK